MAPFLQPDNRHIRVFISSTFLDMQEERDVLIKKIFPQLRRICEERAATWTEVDLRWGITDEQKAEGQVLPLCLEEIRRCRPFFIGLLGDRYGWIPEPDSISSELIDAQPWLKQHINERTSVTELEILHGVFREEKMHGHAYFYFRSSKHLQSMPAEVRQGYMTENAEAGRKLAALKNKIRAAHAEQVCELKEDYANPEQLGKWILEDFTKLIDQLYPKDQTPDALDQEAARHEAYARSRRLGFVVREDLLRRLDEHCSVSGGPIVLIGDAGCGKSALLAEWVRRWHRDHPEDLVIQHYVGSTTDSADWQEVVRRILAELKRAFNISDDIPRDSSALESALSHWMTKAAYPRRVVLLLDGLNQLAEKGVARQLNWLPVIFPANFYLLASTLPGQITEAIHKRSWSELRVPLFAQADIAFVTKAYFKIFSKTPPPEIVSKLESTPAARNPLYLRAILDELRQCGVHEKLETQATHYLAASNAKELYGLIIERWEIDFGIDLVCRSLRLLWAARDGLSESELLGLLGKDKEPMPRAHLTPMLLAADSALVTRSGLMTFSNDFIRSAVAERLCRDANGIRRTRYTIASYFQPNRHHYDRVLSERPWQLAQAGYHAELKDFLLSPLMLRMVRKVRIFNDAKRYWHLLGKEANTGAEMCAAFERMIRATPEPASEGIIANALGVLLSDLGYTDESLWFSRHADNYYQSNLAGSGATQIAIQNNRATALIQAGRLDEARAIQEAILASAKDRGLRDSDEVLGVASNLAHVFHIANDLQRAYDLYRDTAERTARAHGRRHPYYILRHNNELCLALELRNPNVEESDIQDTIETARSVLGPDHETTIVCMHTLGSYYEISGDFQKSLDIYGQVLSITEAKEGQDGLQTLNIMKSCARIRVKMEEYAAANALYSTCFTRAKTRYGPLNPITLECLQWWAASALNSNDGDELHEAFRVVLRAFVSHARQTRSRHSEHDECTELFIRYMLAKGMSHENLTQEYRKILSET